MIIIEDKIISDAVIEEEFVCNLQACKGVCCVEGDGGAPLAESEVAILDDIYSIVSPYLTEAGRSVIAEQGRYVPNEEGGFSTPLINGGACAYLRFDEAGIAKCQIEKAWEDGKIDFKKPISCHLYPIRATRYDRFVALNYFEWDICDPACVLGKALKVPVYRFLKEPLIRAYGEDFYAQLEGAAATHYARHQNNHSSSSDTNL